MKMSNKVYNVLKWVCITLIPALIALYGTVGATLDLPYTQTVLTIAGAVNGCLGTCLGISSHNYHKGQETDNSEFIEEE